MLLFPIGDEEGVRCSRDGCDGTMELEFRGCTCFKSAPCSSCMTSLHCATCGIWTGPDGDTHIHPSDDHEW